MVDICCQCPGDIHTRILERMREVLRENWRSLPAVVAFNNRIIERIVAADNRALNETLAKASEEGSVDPAEAAALRDTLA